MQNKKIEIIKHLTSNQFITKEDEATAIKISEIEFDASSSWFVQLLIGFGAWVASILVGVFFALTGIISSEESALVVGVLLLLSVLVISFKTKNMAIFPSQILLSMSFAGHILFAIGIDTFFGTSDIFGGIFAMLIGVFFLELYNGKLHKMISVWVILFGLWIVLYELGLSVTTITVIIILLTAGIAAWMWLHESYFATSRWKDVTHAIQYSFFIALLLIAGIFEHKIGIFYWGQKPSGSFVLWNIPYAKLVSGGLSMILVFTAMSIFKRLKIDANSILPISIITFLLFFSTVFYHSPSILASLLVLIIGIERGNKILVPLSIFSLIYFYSSYYYNLDLTLMDKSLILMGSGLVMLILGMSLRYGVKRA